MKSLHRLLPLALAALAPLSPAQINLPAQYLALSFASHPGAYDGLMVAVPLGPPVSRPRPGAPWLAFQPVRVEDSRAFVPGTVVDLYFESDIQGRFGPDGRPEAPKIGLPVGQRTLVIARLAQAGTLGFADVNAVANSPAMGSADPPDIKTVALGPESGPAALAEAAYPTTAARLPDAPEPQWRLFGSFASALSDADDALAKNITDQVSSLGATGGTAGRSDSRFSRLFANAVVKSSAYHRALMDYALNRLGYLGYEIRYRRDMLLAGEEPNAFPNGVPLQLGFQEDSRLAYAWPKDYKPAPPIPWGEFMRAIQRLQSPTVAEYLLRNLQKPSDAEVRALAAKYLNFPDPRARWAIVERLAWWNDYPAPEKPVTVVDELTRMPRTDYPGLDAAVAHWKAKLGV